MNDIRIAGGNNAYFRTWLVLIGSVGICIAEWLIFHSLYCAVTAIGMTVFGWMFRKSIMEWGAEYQQRSSIVLLTYGIILFAAKYMGFGNHVQLVVIGIATAFMFNLNFWSISEAVNEERNQALDSIHDQHAGEQNDEPKRNWRSL